MSDLFEKRVFCFLYVCVCLFVKVILPFYICINCLHLCCFSSCVEVLRITNTFPYPNPFTIVQILWFSKFLSITTWIRWFHLSQPIVNLIWPSQLFCCRHCDGSCRHINSTKLTHWFCGSHVHVPTAWYVCIVSVFFLQNNFHLMNSLVILSFLQWSPKFQNTHPIDIYVFYDICMQLRFVNCSLVQCSGHIQC